MDYHGLLNLDLIKLTRIWLAALGLVELEHIWFLAVDILISFPVPFLISTYQILVLLVSWAHIVSLYALPNFGHMNKPLHKHFPFTILCVSRLVSFSCDGEKGGGLSYSCRNF